MKGSFRPQPQSMGRQTFTVPVSSGDYAGERLDLCRPASGAEPLWLQKASALVESLPAGATVELWAMPVADGSHQYADYQDTDYVNTGLTAPTATGVTVWDLGMWPAVQVRVKSGGTGGPAVISAACY